MAYRYQIHYNKSSEDAPLNETVIILENKYCECNRFILFSFVFKYQKKHGIKDLHSQQYHVTKTRQYHRDINGSYRFCFLIGHHKCTELP